MKLLIATENKGKIRELQALLTGLNIQLVTPKEIGLDLKVEEDGSTYAENATKKALAYANASGLLSLADDSGLEVDPLNGEPGLYSARYSPKPNPTDKDRRDHLLMKIKELPKPWTARFRATVVIADPSGIKGVFAGHREGEIVSEERGNNGFGYDPIFFIPERNCTMAQLPEAEKNRISHRAVAVEKALELLRKLTAEK
jgi:XTP/dITP diphosphohydrolase